MMSDMPMRSATRSVKETPRRGARVSGGRVAVFDDTVIPFRA
jgi:hypothetical protein